MGEDWIPVKVRAWVYRILVTVLALNTVFGWFDKGAVDQIVQVAAIFGFGLAAAHTPTKGY